MGVPGRDLDEWADGIRRRSEDAFRAVYAVVADDLASFATGMLRDRRAAEDVVQQAFLELVSAAPKFRGDGRALRAWLFKSVRFGCLDEIRRRSRRPETPTDDLPEQAVVPLPGRDDHPELYAALETLSERQRALVLLRHVSGLSGEEIGKVMGMRRPAVYAALARAERRLRGTLDAGSDEMRRETA